MTDRTNNAATGIVGVRADGKDVPEAEHFFVCDDCGQAVDMRQLGDVFHHDEPGHAPLPADA